MKSLLVLIAGFVLTFQSLDLNTIRNAYKAAAQDKTKTEAFYNSLEKVTKNSKVELVAYKGAAIALLAKQAITLKEKKEGFIQGVTLVEYAITKAPNNIEVRFIRLGIQENTPKILKYKGNIEEDKLFILKQYKNISSSRLKKHIKDYILQSKAFTDEEKTLILDS
ncbi:hypothetical protein KO494_01450 [Lacinutrix sp. C3R15]|uniref:hypothetical protein n=1 Tax=Flavobacteriaceae TaxID=49546 RepID=UPI001C08B8D5|nr:MULTISPECIES: hypothetical protein [Flavobacteriaceae]MBU2938193.1 hypothetical protein [Lacinutrix sp. C3R15]MDO6621507.1 hypothetical protein [Oceanihabitans sp. 1_MG-2023]